MKPVQFPLFFVCCLFCTLLEAQTLSQWDSLLSAEPTLEQANKALLQAEKQTSKQDSFYARFLYYKGWACENEGLADSAAYYYRKALKIQETHYTQHSDHAHTLTALGEYYRNKENYNEALRYHQKALEIRTQQDNVKRRDKTLLERYNELYNVQRIRHNDCVNKLAEDFFLTEPTVNRIVTKKMLAIEIV